MSDDVEFSDEEQGIPAMRGTMCKVYRIEKPAFWKPFGTPPKSWGGTYSEAATKA